MPTAELNIDEVNDKSKPHSVGHIAGNTRKKQR
jgi:hypothetical protein